MTYFIWSAKTVLKTSNFFLFAPTSPILLFKPWECKCVISKINLIVLINAFFNEKIQDFNINSTKIGD